MEKYEKYIGQVFDNRYKLENIIGVGGMAVVYKAIDMLMRRVVAVKILRDDISADEPSVQRFINESKAVAMLSHPNIVNIYDVSVRDDVKYIVMEYIEGITLKSYMTRREVLSFKEVVGYTIQILRALEHAHQKGIVHRDIKPQNIMLLRDGVIKVMDFGIAKLPNAETVTMTDKAIGTVYYISPEQASGEAIDARSDLYSLGVLMYEMSSGRLPFDADSPVSVALKQVNDTPVLPREINSKIPVGLEQIIMNAMEKKPELRYQNAEQMLGQLLKLRENPNIIFKPTASEKIKKFFSSKFKFGKMNKTMFPIIIGVFTSFLIVFCISGFYIFNKVFNNSSVKGYETIAVDNFVGAEYSDEMKKWFEDSDYFKVVDVEYKYSENAEPGTIIEQSPSEGVKKKVLAGKQFCKMKLVVSGGEEKVKLDDYSVRDYRIVVSELRSKGIKCSISKVYNDIYEIGYVVSTNPEAGAELNPGDSIEIFVSRGPDTGDIKVPNFVGKTEAQALLEISVNNLAVGSVKYERSSEEAGTILSQSVSAETLVFKHTPIDFVVSGGPKYGIKDTDSNETKKPDEKETKEKETSAQSTEDTETDMKEPITIDATTDDPDTTEETTSESTSEESTDKKATDPITDDESDVEPEKKN